MPDTQPEPSRDTIAAIATPPGRGGIGIVRLSGPDALTIVMPLLRGLPGPLAHQQARFCHLVDPATGKKLDEAVVTFFQGPRSYTGEDVVEIAAHGSPVLLDRLLRLALSAGARMAAPGEFTERAFLAGRLDLTQAEAVRDLIAAQTLLQAQIAAQQLGGALSRRIGPLKQELIALIAVLEAGIDFAEDDTPVLDNAVLEQRLLAIEQALAQLERSFARGRLVMEGTTLAIVGRPNAGKSSLFNRLLDRERAIVTAEPGTTRDTVQEQLSLDGIPIQLVDTAGLREAASEAERIGIAKSREAFADAGLVLLVLNSMELLNDEEEALLEAAKNRRLLIALNKCDLLTSPSILRNTSVVEVVIKPAHPATNEIDLPPISSTFSSDSSIKSISKLVPAVVSNFTSDSDPNAASHAGNRGAQLGPPLHVLQRLHAIAPNTPAILCSAHTGEGLETLRTSMKSMLVGEEGIMQDSVMLTSLRQHTAVATAQAAMQSSLAAADNILPHEMLLLDLYTALHELDALTGTTTPDDILNLIFSTFCIGK